MKRPSLAQILSTVLCTAVGCVPGAHKSCGAEPLPQTTLCAPQSTLPPMPQSTLACPCPDGGVCVCKDGKCDCGTSCACSACQGKGTWKRDPDGDWRWMEHGQTAGVWYKQFLMYYPVEANGRYGEPFKIPTINLPGIVPVSRQAVFTDPVLQNCPS